MRSLVLAAGLMAAVVTTGARAADLDDGPLPDRYGSAYDDPRYADIYKYPKGPGYVVPPPYASPYGRPPPYLAPIPRERVYRDDDDDDFARPRRYSYVEPVPPYGTLWLFPCAPLHANVKKAICFRSTVWLNPIGHGRLRKARDFTGDLQTVGIRRLHQNVVNDLAAHEMCVDAVRKLAAQG